MVSSSGSGILALPNKVGHVEMSAGGVAINSGTDISSASRVWRGITWLLALALLPVLGGERARAEEPAESALPQLPEKYIVQLETERLRRQIALEQLRLELEALQGSEEGDVGQKVERLRVLQRLLEVDRDVRDLLVDSPEMAEEYDRIVRASAPRTAETPQGPCACLENVRVHWLGRGDQAGQAIVYLDGLYHELSAGEGIGNCSAQEVRADSVVLQCRGQTSTRGLHNPVGRDLAGTR